MSKKALKFFKISIFHNFSDFLSHVLKIQPLDSTFKKTIVIVYVFSGPLENASKGICTDRR